jgi:hypothetical protein
MAPLCVTKRSGARVLRRARPERSDLDIDAIALTTRSTLNATTDPALALSTRSLRKPWEAPLPCAIQASSTRLRFWTKSLFRRGTMTAIIGVSSALRPPGRTSTVRVNRVPSPSGPMD